MSALSTASTTKRTFTATPARRRHLFAPQHQTFEQATARPMRNERTMSLFRASCLRLLTLPSAAVQIPHLTPLSKAVVFTLQKNISTACLGTAERESTSNSVLQVLARPYRIRQATRRRLWVVQGPSSGCCKRKLSRIWKTELRVLLSLSSQDMSMIEEMRVSNRS